MISTASREFFQKQISMKTYLFFGTISKNFRSKNLENLQSSRKEGLVGVRQKSL